MFGIHTTNKRQHSPVRKEGEGKTVWFRLIYQLRENVLEQRKLGGLFSEAWTISADHQVPVKRPLARPNIPCFPLLFTLVRCSHGNSSTLCWTLCRSALTSDWCWAGSGTTATGSPLSLVQTHKARLWKLLWLSWGVQAGMTCQSHIASK